MKLALCLFLTISLAGSFSALYPNKALANTTVPTLIRELPNMEVYHGLLFHSNHLWLGVIRQTPEEPHHVEVYTADHQLVATLDLPHAVQKISPFGPDKVLIVGKSAEPYWTGYVTVVSVDTFEAKSIQLPSEYLIDDLLRDETHGTFFSEVSTRTIYSTDSIESIVSGNFGSVNKFGPDISGPGAMVASEDSLWVIERRNLFQDGDEDIARINFKTGELTRPFNGEGRLGLHDITYIADRNLIAVTEALRSRVLFIDPVTNSEIAAVDVQGDPRNIITIGKCVAAISPIEKRLSVIATNASPSLVADLDLSSAGELLGRPRAVTFNENTQTFYVRSAYPCGNCDGTQSSVFAFTDASTETSIRKHCY